MTMLGVLLLSLTVLLLLAVPVAFALVLASLFFYAYWNWVHLPLILVSIGLNFLLGRRLARWPAGGDLRHKRRWLIAGIAANLLALAALTSPKLGDKALKPGRSKFVTVNIRGKFHG